MVAHVRDNQTLSKGVSNPTYGIEVETSLTNQPGDELCLSFIGNVSDTGFLFQNFDRATLQVEPLVGNHGSLSVLGTVTPVMPHTCMEQSVEEHAICC
jgi:hypothetical protein